MHALNIGEYWMLDNSFYQYPSFLVYRIKDLFADKAVIEQIIYVGKKDPYSGHTSFNKYIADRSFAIISNAKPLDEHVAITMVFGRLWDIHE